MTERTRECHCSTAPYLQCFRPKLCVLPFQVVYLSQLFLLFLNQSLPFIALHSGGYFFLENLDKIKVGSLAIMVTLYLRPITLRPVLSDSLPFSTFAKATYSLLFILFPNLKGFRQDCKKNCKFFFIDRFAN